MSTRYIDTPKALYCRVEIRGDRGFDFVRGADVGYRGRRSRVDVTIELEGADPAFVDEIMRWMQSQDYPQAPPSEPVLTAGYPELPQGVIEGVLEDKEDRK